MANKGLQFEHAVMYAATSRITGTRTKDQQKFFDGCFKVEYHTKRYSG